MDPEDVNASDQRWDAPWALFGTGLNRYQMILTHSGRDQAVARLVSEVLDPTLRSAPDDPRIVRTFYVDNPGAEIVVAKAREMRERAGTLSGHCLGDDAQLTPAASLLDHMAVTFARAEVTKLPSESVLELLATLRPAVLAGWTPEAPTAGRRGSR